ncbi:tetratricopeptide repeat protein [Planctomycetota bacterium]|nr:tetratricopeptide repeat protein [Planctomycetota bacterium]
MNQTEVATKTDLAEGSSVVSDAGVKWHHVLPLLMVVLGVLAYANSMYVPFVLDDVPRVERYVGMSWGDFLNHIWFTSRPIADATMYINGLISGADPWSYHLFNTIVHISGALLLFGIVRRVLMVGRFGERLQKNAHWFAFAVAGLWLVHPLQTQAVTYVIQRHESLMGLFYITVIYSLIRLSESEKKETAIVWGVLGIVACFLGMATKQVMVTAPILAVLFDRCFIAKSWSEMVKKRGLYYVGLIASWGVIAWTMHVESVAGDASAGFDSKVLTPMQYLLSQGEVIVSYYLKLAFWPDALVLDYYNGVVPAILRENDPTWWMTCGVVGVLLLASFYGIARMKWWGFCGMWFFLILGPTSSFMPIIDIIFEHRMYLSLIAVICVTVFVVDWLLVKLIASGSLRTLVEGGGIAIVLATLVFLTYVRNIEYSSGISIWSSVVERVPFNARGWHNLGAAYDEDGQSDIALASFSKTLEIIPEHAETLNSIGKIRLDQDFVEEAASLFQRAIKKNDQSAHYHYNLGRAYWTLKLLDQAELKFNDAIALNDEYATAYNNLGLVYAIQNKNEQAAEAFKKAIELDSGLTDAYYNLGTFYLKNLHANQAIEMMSKALSLEPGRVDVMNGLGQGYAMNGQLREAWKILKQANVISPRYMPVIGNMSVVAVGYAKTGDRVTAIKYLREVVTLAERGGLPPQLVQGFKSKLKAVENNAKF